MEKREKQMETRFNGRWIFETNKGIIIDLNESVITYKCDIMRLKRKLSWAYWAIIIFSSLTLPVPKVSIMMEVGSATPIA